MNMKSCLRESERGKNNMMDFTKFRKHLLKEGIEFALMYDTFEELWEFTIPTENASITLQVKFDHFRFKKMYKCVNDYYKYIDTCVRNTVKTGQFSNIEVFNGKPAKF